MFPHIVRWLHPTCETSASMLARAAGTLRVSLYSVAHCVLRSFVQYGAIAACSNAVVGPAKPGPLSSVQPTCATPVFSLLIHSCRIMLFLLSCAHSSRSFEFSRRMASCNCRAPLPLFSRVMGAAVWVDFAVLLISSCLINDMMTFALLILLMVLHAHRTLGTLRFLLVCFI